MRNALQPPVHVTGRVIQRPTSSGLHKLHPWGEAAWSGHLGHRVGGELPPSAAHTAWCWTPPCKLIVRSQPYGSTLDDTSDVDDNRQNGLPCWRFVIKHRDGWLRRRAAAGAGPGAWRGCRRPHGRVPGGCQSRHPQVAVVFNHGAACMHACLGSPREQAMLAVYAAATCGPQCIGLL